MKSGDNDAFQVFDSAESFPFYEVVHNIIIKPKPKHSIQIDGTRYI